MAEGASFGIVALLPLLLTLILAFLTKDAIFSLLIGCVTGVFVLGGNPLEGFITLVEDSLGNGDFIWIVMIQIFVGILIAFFMKAGVVKGFEDLVKKRVKSRKGVQVASWASGLAIIDDYFHPILAGVVMRPICDKARVSREKLAFILDSTSAPMCTLVPFTAWGAYIASLLVKQGGPITDVETGLYVFTRAIPLNFYSVGMVLLVLLISLGIIKDYGPMKKAENRIIETGEIFDPGSKPMVGQELEEINSGDITHKVSLATDLLIPMLIVFGIGIASFIILKSIKILEAFIIADIYLACSLFAKKVFKSPSDMIETAMKGIKGVMTATMILALAYCINTLTKQLGAADFVLSMTEGWMTPKLLVAITFISGALISFFTGTSWGTFAIMVPFTMPIAYSLSGGAITPLVFKAVAAIVGGGIFGDHASPVSDTTVLSSFGAGCDHIDHVKTQLPYALTVATITILLYTIF